jgi:Polysaccharide lyase
VLAISSPPEGGWTAPLQKGQGWHKFVMKVFHHDDPTKGRLNLWYKPPGATRYSKVIHDHATSTWNGHPGRMYHKIGYYRGAEDPPGAEPWIDLRGTIMSSDHEIE